jgi:hypothetical protein
MKVTIDTAHVDNILRVWNGASDSSHAKGTIWYARARAWCEGLGSRTCVGTNRVAGVLAALSPSVAWEINLRDAKAMVEGRSETYAYGYATYGKQVGKALAILEGEDVESSLGPLAHKTRAFYRCIMGPSDYGGVCVDRHGIAVALGRVASARESSLSVGKYRAYEVAYQVAALEVGVLPSVLQAVAWLEWRRQLANEVPI